MLSACFQCGLHQEKRTELGVCSIDRLKRPILLISIVFEILVRVITEEAYW